VAREVDHVKIFKTEARRRFAFLEEPPHGLRWCGAFLRYPDEPRDTHTEVRYLGPRVMVTIVMNHIGLGLYLSIGTPPPDAARVPCRRVRAQTVASFDDYLLMAVGEDLPRSPLLGRFRVLTDFCNERPGRYTNVALKHLVDLIDLMATQLRDHGAALLAGDAELLARTRAYGQARQAPSHGGDVPRHHHDRRRRVRRRLRL